MPESPRRQLISASSATLARLNTYNYANFNLRCFALYLINSFNQSTAWIIPVLLTFLQLKYQGNDQQTPFTTHSMTMNVAVYSSIVYYLVYCVQLRFTLHVRLAGFVNHCLVWSGYASVASLASVLLPDSARPFLYGLFVMLPASEFLNWFYNKYCKRFLVIIWRVLANSSGELTLTLPR
ncbi:hypothetical protein Salat_1696500 [Sesamum alatum]|uniref:Uncharacterized protein n=1 Tax=Sesamum alatum TaxID=300844 RepID=A0AAE2CK92_9LAMI|nr:hypothetical protein Salat_1696500 [Sesamum alatum]